MCLLNNLFLSFQLEKHIYNETLFLTLSPCQQELSLFDIGYTCESPNFGLNEA